MFIRFVREPGQAQAGAGVQHMAMLMPSSKRRHGPGAMETDSSAGYPPWLAFAHARDAVQPIGICHGHCQLRSVQQRPETGTRVILTFSPQCAGAAADRDADLVHFFVVL